MVSLTDVKKIFIISNQRRRRNTHIHFKKLKGKKVLLHNAYVLYACMWSRRVYGPLSNDLHRFLYIHKEDAIIVAPIKIIFINMLLST